MCSLTLQNLQGITPQKKSSSLNSFGISTIIPDKKISTDQKNDLIAQRIIEELGENFTLQDIFNFLRKIQDYYDHLLNTQTLNDQTLLLAKLALQDIQKAKMSPYIKSNTVTPDDEHNLRVEIGKLSRQINPHN